eukprot:COSAG04_NODE_313_length_17126_cov_17.159922_7_plen_86_part_00
MEPAAQPEPEPAPAPAAAEQTPALATAAVLEVKCEPMPADAVPIRGYDFNDGVDYERLLQTYRHIGFQAAHFGLAVDEINRMISW